MIKTINNKKIIIFLSLLICLIITTGLFSYSYANENGRTSTIQVFDDEELELLDEEADFPEKMGSSIVLAVPNFITRIIKLEDPTILIYGKNVPDSSQELVGNIWNNKEHGFLDSLYHSIFKVVPKVLIGIIIISGILLLIKITSSGQEFAKSLAFGIFVAGLIFKMTPHIFNTLFRFNEILVNMAWNLLNGNEKGVSFLDMFWRKDTKSLGMALITFFAIFIIGTLNFQYNVRKLMLGILFVFTPIVAMVSIIPSRKTALNIWLNELISNIFLQSTHAFALTFFIKFLSANNSFWIAIAGLMSLNAIAMLIRSLFGLSNFEGNTARGMSANLMGLGAVLGMARLIKSTQKTPNRDIGKSIETNSLLSNNDDPAITTASPTGDGNNTFKTPSPIGDFAKSSTKKLATGVGTMGLGIAGGLAMSTMGQNPAMGFGTGAMAGHYIGNKVAQGGINAIDRTKDWKQTIEEQGSLKNAIAHKSDFYDDTQFFNVKETINMGNNLGTSIMGSKIGGSLGSMAGEIIAKRNISQGKRGIISLEKGTSIKKDMKIDTSAINQLTLDDNETYMTGLRRSVELAKQKLEASQSNFDISKTELEYVELEHGTKSPQFQKVIVEYRQHNKEMKHNQLECKELKKELKHQEERETTIERLQKYRRANIDVYYTNNRFK